MMSNGNLDAGMSSEQAKPESPLAELKRAGSAARSGLVAVAALVALLWIIEALDAVLPGNWHRFGVRPHRVAGLRGIVFAPFLHAGWWHVIANTVPLAVLGALVAVGGLKRFASVFVLVAVISGLGMWILGSSNEVHIGASGVVFGLLTYLVVRGFFARKLGQIAVGIGVAMAYGGLLFGVLPTRSGVSWQGHLFGAIGGVVAAWVLDRKRPPTPPS